jgi:hypothetical protein
MALGSHDMVDMSVFAGDTFCANGIVSLQARFECAVNTLGAGAGLGQTTAGAEVPGVAGGAVLARTLARVILVGS